MDGGVGAQYNPRTVEEVFRDFKGRRAGMIKALTTDVEDFYQQCDPGWFGVLGSGPSACVAIVLAMFTGYMNLCDVSVTPFTVKFVSMKK
ncbi:hypothetical protein JRO89_XS09G0225500 [Xanthoceras sorbifolium]|uniref:PHD finger protein ALFIN-LIKE n=1 Tax=Xanthoceras sorbifolium TaxID=99658 RepID=A0ABQ8HMR0_9ROSI|nr:hypothetical protein JRO89_XS09G0225500 [Xanthoceras sorbifolium]